MQACTNRTDVDLIVQISAHHQTDGIIQHFDVIVATQNQFGVQIHHVFDDQIVDARKMVMVEFNQFYVFQMAVALNDFFQNRGIAASVCDINLVILVICSVYDAVYTGKQQIIFVFGGDDNAQFWLTG